MMLKNKWKEWSIDIFVDLMGGTLIAIGIYNFAVNAKFPMTGFSGIALIFYHLFGLPIGVMTIVLNIPVAIVCYRLLGKSFMLRSLKTMILSSIIIDVVAPLFPVYTGDRMLAAICTGVFSGLGYAMIYLRNSSTGGTDFIMMSIKAKHPHLSLGKIAFAQEVVIILLGGLIFKGIDGIIYAMIVNFLLALVIDKVMYGIDSGKMALIVTNKGQKVADKIDEFTQRGATILRGSGSFTQEEKQVVMCACNNKQMNYVRKAVKEVDKQAFIVIMESNEVLGEGFKHMNTTM